MNKPAPVPQQSNISLVRSTPPAVGDVTGAFVRTLNEIAADPSCARLIQEHRFGGTFKDKETASRWLERRFRSPVDPNRIVVMGSAQNAMAILLSHLAGPGEGVAVEELSYHGLRMIAGFKGNILHPVAMDGEGALVDALEQAFQAKKPKLAFLMPTLQNPTTAVMSEERRLEVAEVAREHGVTLVEDDVYGGLIKDAPRPISAIAGDGTWYITSFAKTIGPGVRLAYVVAPTSTAADHLVRSIQGISYWFPTPLAAEIGQRWISDGTMEALSEKVREEAIARQAIAGDCLAGLDVTTKPEALFSWLKLPAGVSEAFLISLAADKGITLRSGGIFEEKHGASNGYIRLVVGSPDNQDDLRYALQSIAEIIGSVK